MKAKNRILSFLLCIAILVGLIPIVMAAGEPATAQEALPSKIHDEIFGEYGLNNLHPYFDPAAFEYDGKTYYLGIPEFLMNDGKVTEQDVHANHISGSLKAGNSTDYDCALNFFTASDGGGFASFNPVDAETREKLISAFNGSLSLKYYVEEAGMKKASISPLSCELPFAAEYAFDSDMADGFHFLVASGTINGTTITAMKSFEIELDTEPDNPLATNGDVLPQNLKNAIYDQDGNADNAKMQPVPFTYKENTYYLGAAYFMENGGSVTTEWMIPGAQNAIGGEITNQAVCPEFFTFSTFFEPVTDPALREELLTAFNGTPSLKLYIDDTTDKQTGEEVRLPLCEPIDNDGYPASKTYTYDIDTNGIYYYVVSGTVGGDTITCVVKHSYHNIAGYAQYVSTIEDANNVLQHWANLKNIPDDAAVMYDLYFAPTTDANKDAMTGRLYIPELPGGLPVVTLRGVEVNPEYPDVETVIYGCVENDSNVVLEYIHIKGCGKDHDTWPEGTKNAGLRNVGCFGTQALQYAGCTFEDLSIGVEARHGGGFGSRNCGFINCGIGLDVDTDENTASSSEIIGNVYNDNDVAIHIKNFGEGFPFLYYFRIKKTSFINNKTDVKNNSGNKFFLPGNYVYHEGDTSSQLEKYSANAYLYPVARDQSFKEFTYEWDNASICNELARDYPIPVGNLDGKSIDVYESEDSSLIANISFEEPQRLLLLALRLGAAPTFDPTLKYEKKGNTIYLTVNDAPSGKKPIITLPVEGVTAATVKFGGNEIASEVLENAVQFTAEKGGTYEITVTVPVKSTTTSSTGSETVSVENSANGQVLLNPGKADPGKTVQVTLKPNSGFAAGRIFVTDENGDPVAVKDLGNGRFSFTMVKGATIQPLFKPILVDDAASCGKDQNCLMNKYNDLEGDNWYHNGVHFCLKNGLMVGVDNNRFLPNGDTTRGMMMTILARMDGMETADSKPWYQKGMQWAKMLGISDGTNPQAAITREQMAAMLYRYASLQGRGFSGSWMFKLDFIDADKISAWANEAVHWCVMNGILNGKPGKMLDPNGTLTRAEAAAMLYRFCRVINE